MNNYFANTGGLTKFMFRRERFRILIWVVGLTLFTLMVAYAFLGMFQTEAEYQAMAVTMANPAMVAMVGPVYGAEHYREGQMMANEMLLFTVIAVVIMNIFFVIRHTRRDEEHGRLDMIRSLRTGRLSTLGATMFFAFLVNVFLSVMIGLSLTSLQIESIDFAGSMLYGAVLGTSGMFFAALTAVFSQLFVSARGVMGYSIAALGILYLMRASGDISNEMLSLISPLGLILRTKVYVENSWHPVLIILGITAVIILLAFYLNSIRDVGQGFIAARKGRAYASALLKAPQGLAFRLLRTTWITWGIGLFILGAAYGSVIGDMKQFLATNNEYRKAVESFAGQSLIQAQPEVMVTTFVTMLISVIAMICAVSPISMMLKLKGEENRNHLEHILSRPVSRIVLMRSFLLPSLAGCIVMIVLAVFGLWLVGSIMSDIPLDFLEFMKSSAVYLPSMFIMVGFSAFFVGVLPKYASFIWIYLGYSLFAVYIGSLIELPKWAAKLSPFGNVPKIPIEEFSAVPMVIECGMAVLLIILGFAGFGKRDMKG